MAKHYYALVNANNDIVRTVGPLEGAPGNVDHHIWAQVYETGPAHNPDLHEPHAHEFVWEAGQVVRRFKIRRKANG